MPCWIAVLTCISAVLCLARTWHEGKEQSNAPRARMVSFAKNTQDIPYCYYYLRVYILRIFAIWKNRKIKYRKNFYQQIRPSGLVCMYVQSQTAWCLIILFWSSLPFFSSFRSIKSSRVRTDFSEKNSRLFQNLFKTYLKVKNSRPKKKKR